MSRQGQRVRSRQYWPEWYFGSGTPSINLRLELQFGRALAALDHHES
jgi:hypothetical protein